MQRLRSATDVHSFRRSTVFIKGTEKGAAESKWLAIGDDRAMRSGMEFWLLLGLELALAL